MPRALGLCIAIFTGFAFSTIAQTQPAPTPVTKYDGTYNFVSQVKLNETFMTTGSGRIRRCSDPPLKTRPLRIANGQARYTSPRGLQFEGWVGQEGDLEMRILPTPSGVSGRGSPGIEETLDGKIDRNGSIRARRIGYNCSYLIVFQKTSR